jgi:hypothetical protein
LVVVAFVEVEFNAVKFCKVDDPVERRLPTVASDEVNALVNDPEPAKKFVVVAFVEVLFKNVMFCKVLEAMEMKPALKVVEAVVKRPLVKAMVVEVETP